MFCSLKCHNKWMAEHQKGKNTPRYGIKHKIESIEKMSKSHKGMYDGEKNPSWKGGFSFIPYYYLFNTHRKRMTSNFFGDICICCGKHVTENITKRGQVALSIHHVDHDKKQGCDGKPFNLVPLCSSCHAKELFKEDEYREYINKTLYEGFKWGIWSREQYIMEVMYSE